MDIAALSDAPEEALRPTTPEGEAPETLHNHKNYYFDDTMSIFLVGNQRFKVHRYFLIKESQVFQWMFACPPGSSDPDGGSDDRAIPVPGVTPFEFENLLDFFYTEKFQRHQAAMADWVAVLAISTRFDFQRVRDRAIDAIEHSRWNQPKRGKKITIDPVEQIVLAEKHDIPHWLPIAYYAICERGHSLEEWEAERIGYRKTVLLARAREEVRNPHHVHSTATLPQNFGSPPGSPIFYPVGGMPLTEPGTPVRSNDFYHNRPRVEAIVNEVFFPPAPSTRPPSPYAG
ncbi:hypothetical protein C8F04DRAFT_1240185 [Mycena alexandri]|uniref:BTB domain-containing protein n=1 Tax=Mycena alexandri TaxID=1745969 RepID=A0AAD6SA34_9AGAR|nr:hypothetical protein C8F04DRAFT_1240185 [Mycena alexandri]